MVYIECGKYFRICDDCGEVREIQRQSYNKLLKKDVHLCLSCCQKCGSRKNLEVHHLRPFRDILRDVSKKLNLNLSKYNEWSVEELNLFREEIIKEHKLEDGITLCKLCHMEEDRFRRRFKDD